MQWKSLHLLWLQFPVPYYLLTRLFQTFLFSHWNEELLCLTVFPVSPIIWTGAGLRVCVYTIRECDLTCAGSLCLLAV